MPDPLFGNGPPLIITASLLALASGCKGKYDGTWLIFYQLTDDSENPDNSYIGVEYRTTASFYRTGTMVAVGMGSGLLTGTQDGKDFEVSQEEGVTYSSEECQLWQESTEMALEGTFGSDLSFDGELTDTDSMVIQGCDWYDDAQEQQVLKYDVTGVLVDSNPDRHGSDSTSWGYIPFYAY